MLQKVTDRVKLLESEVYTRRERNTKYLMELQTENLLYHYYTEAGLKGSMHYKQFELHGGWDSVTSEIRGTLTGHWLSAAAYTYAETGNIDIKTKADYIVKEIRRCQVENGGQWAFPIPQKYLYGLKNGKSYWAPQYVCHKVMMGLLDMYVHAKNETALEIVKECADWFYDYANGITRENMTSMMNVQETGGLMEFWCDLYSVTDNPKHLELVKKYEQPDLFEPIFEGRDVLTNMHANKTIAEIHGAARAYEITKDARYRKIVENYWELAVTKRGMFATGGQTCGEVWTPMDRQSARLGDMNQEHCVVYNMIRLADYLFKWTGASEYSDYIERNIINGLMAQGHWEESVPWYNPKKPDTGLIAYYLPLRAGGQKYWGRKTEDFWCCHNTLIQANSRLREFIYYNKDKEIIVSQYIPSELNLKINDTNVKLEQKLTDLGGNHNIINDISISMNERPKYLSVDFQVKAEKECEFSIKFRIPWWIQGDFKCLVNGETVAFDITDGFAVIKRSWLEDKIQIIIPKGLSCWPLADEPDTVAFLDGPVVLAGLVEEERMLFGDINHPETMLKPYEERVWMLWQPYYKTFNQQVGFYFKPLNQIGREKYTVYFPIRPKK